MAGYTTAVLRTFYFYSLVPADGWVEEKVDAPMVLSFLSEFGAVIQGKVPTELRKFMYRAIKSQGRV
jgi:hypothetical protein